MNRSLGILQEAALIGSYTVSIAYKVSLGGLLNREVPVGVREKESPNEMILVALQEPSAVKVRMLIDSP